ncbi:hypothetical protein CA13_32400 [Planctomycetes bacterium CA13]|uniref:Uncharacterized protein n=1 Tax=Novipirellula herctigrandis TaxID=2527986 RepID=A0A5C5Z466_9BACT|nr:hypothetical protein CA13_32400 [Planctomycetes bacterium CA13]
MALQTKPLALRRLLVVSIVTVIAIGCQSARPCCDPNLVPRELNERTGATARDSSTSVFAESLFEDRFVV